MNRLGTEDLIDLSDALHLGLLAGKDLQTSLGWLEINAVSKSARDFCSRLRKLARTTNWEESLLLLEIERSRPEQRIFVEILSQSRKGSLHLSQLLKVFSGSIKMLNKLQKRQRSLLFVSKFQAGVGLFTAILFGIILPILSPTLFPSFAHFGRLDLGLVGFSGILIGFVALYWMGLKPKRNFQDILHRVFFWIFLSVFIQSGMDLNSAWQKSVLALNFPPDIRDKFDLRKANFEGFGKFIEELETTLPMDWRKGLVGLRWVHSQGFGLSSYLKDLAHDQSEEVFFRWDDEIRKLSTLSILPMTLFIFPSVMFLLVGPRFLEILQ